MPVPNVTPDVSATSSTATQSPVSNTESQATQFSPVPAQGQEHAPTVPVSELAPQAGQEQESDEDTLARNREFEWKRKHDQLVDRLPEYIDHAVQEAAKTFRETVQQQQQTSNQSAPQYTPEQLRAILLDDTGMYNTNNKIWAQEQLDVINEQRMAKLLDDKFQTSQKHVQERKLKSDSEAYVIRTFPEMFKKDINGNIVGWDNTNPLVASTARYMKQFGDHPEALKLAANQAFLDYQLQNRGQSMRETELARAETAKLKRQNIGVGAGSAEISALQSQVRLAEESFRKSGSVADAKNLSMLRGRLSALNLRNK